MESENEEGIETLSASGFRSKVQETPTGKLDFRTYGCDGQVSLISPPDSGSNRKFGSKVFSHEQSTFDPSPSTSFASIPRPSISTTSGHQNPSQWELRSRSSSPSSLLNSQTNRSREQRKSKFLDRIRRRRDDDRSEQVGEQVLRMDFVKERRVWEREMARRAAMEAAQEEEVESEDDDDDDEEEEPELSPTHEFEEDVEVDELIRQYQQEQLQTVKDDEFVVEDAEDEEYERLFREMEILSQHSQPLSQNLPASQPPRPENERVIGQTSLHTAQTSLPGEPPLPQHGNTLNDETMDLS
ncbi:hypothetical protein Z517_05584 [Fonsecaea pedrosoi CBS 271.37]|uniref:Uncharacterized protein n=1 Tax=Fonsecaea pedrosoi CBS 271.37 TaxID=1442368 RepID=A0A0D2F7K5_9EURO|nr:uncharacterized protein Z517_05584 [Fonsecaea pedrosoi CBS 271.37]KIW82557.1 hypothetical protein Z517_05584 [Fonsecaea pedrosoi CBS 271.37]